MVKTQNSQGEIHFVCKHNFQNDFYKVRHFESA